MLNSVFLTSRSVTLAQRMEKALRKNRIPARIERPDISITDGSCAYAVVISELYLPEAVELLRNNSLLPRKIIIEEGLGNFREIYI